jgi:large subunit ribosomal protein L14e
LDVTLGEIVDSTAGRDSGKRFLIIKIIDDKYVLLADGSSRRIENAKKKKLKHIKSAGVTIQSINEKLENGLKVTNLEIRKALDSHQKEQ